MRLPLSLLFFSFILSVSFCDTTTINSVGDFITFANSVNSGTYFSETTVFLNADIDFTSYSGQFTPIGNSTNYNNHFRGTFDGQGHVIGNLTVSTSSSSLYTGLFGYSTNTAIRNVVIDDTCSFGNSFVSSVSEEEEPCVGSIIGHCESINGACTIENIVNMASVTYGGDVTVSAYVGGIVGVLSLDTYSGSIKNCVNYGTVTDSGKCTSSGGKWAEIGGIVGGSQGKSSLYNYIQNCANYGFITHNGTTSNLAIGGVAGFGYYSSIQNCVSSGVISSNQDSDCIGTIVGAISGYAQIGHCYWTSDVGDFNVYDPDETITVSATNIYLVSLNKTTVEELNEYATEQDSTWSKWFMVHLDGGRINNITQESLAEIQGHFPDPVKEENVFLFWFKDPGCTDIFDPKTDSVSGITDIYAGWITSTTSIYVVSFDFDNGTVVNETFSYGSSIVYPNDVAKEGHTLSWNNYHGYMPAKNITTTAQWTPNNYTVTLDFGNGTILASIEVTFNKPYGTLPTPAKEGYTFVGWVTNNNVTVTSETIVIIPNNHTLHARWKEIPTQYVEIVFGTKDMTEEEVNDLVKKYVNASDFTIVKIEASGESGETRVIIRFNSAEKAENFVEVIKESDGTKNVGFISEEDIPSFTMTYFPMALLSIFIWM